MVHDDDVSDPATPCDASPEDDDEVAIDERRRHARPCDADDVEHRAQRTG